LINWNRGDVSGACDMFRNSYCQKVLGTRPPVYT
jgi:hypothetical protein